MKVPGFECCAPAHKSQQVTPLHAATRRSPLFFTPLFCTLLFYIGLFWVMLPGLHGVAVAQTPSSATPAGRSPAARLSLGKTAIERRFRSVHPAALPHLEGAVPGFRLLDQRTQTMAQASPRSSVHAKPKDGTSTAGQVLPGIQLRPTLPAGAIPTSVTTGDFNKDGIMDFVVANGEANDLWIYFGKGDGTFQLPRLVPLSNGSAPVFVASGDLRGIGTLDLVVAENDSSTVGVLLGNGDGTFGYETPYALPDPPSAIVLRDFNHDGKLDIATALVTAHDFSSPPGVPVIALLAGDGAGNFAAAKISYRPELDSAATGLDAADINGDGLPDLLLSDPASSGPTTGATVYLNNGDGTFTIGQNLVTDGMFNDVQDGRFGDINEDGCPDAVIADESGQVWTALGDCTGHFAAPTWFSTGDSNAAIQLADLNGDGHLDVVTSTFPGTGENYGVSLGFSAGNTLNVALGDGKGGFSVSRNYLGAGQSTSLAIADFNGDGKPEVVTANSDTDSVTVYPNDGAGAFGFPQGIYVGLPGDGVIDAPASSPSFVDLNGDGTPDLVFLNAQESAEYYLVSLTNDGTGRFNTPKFLDLHENRTTSPLGDYRVGTFRNARTQDFLAVAAVYSNTSYLLFAPGNGDGSFGAPVLTNVTGAQGTMATGDFNGDGKLDFVAVSGTTTNTLTTFLGNGDGTFRAAGTVGFSDANYEVYRVYSGDFNHDGKLDILVFKGGNGGASDASAVWEFDGNGDGTFQPARQVLSDIGAIALGDVNGDGLPDLATFSSILAPASTVATFLGQADGTFTQHSTYTPYAGLPLQTAPYDQFGDPLAVSLLGDYNHDGKPEEVDFQQAGSAGIRYAQFLMGNGDGTFTPTYDLFPFYRYGWPAFGHDLDADGFTDMLELDSGSSALHVIKGAPAPALQITLNDKVVTGYASCGVVYPDITTAADRTVILGSLISGVQLPASVTVPAQATSAPFCYTLSPSFDDLQVFNVTATLDGSSASAFASAVPIQGFALSVSPNPAAPVYAGQTTAPMTVSLTAAPGYSATVQLSCGSIQRPGDICQLGATSLALTAGQTSTTSVTFTTSPNDGVQSGIPDGFTLTASDGTITHQQAVTVPVSSLLIATPNGVPSISSPETVTFPVTVTGIPPYELSCSGLPSTVTCSIAGTASAYPAVSSYTATIAAGSGVPPGSYPFTIAATSGTATASAQEALNVIDFTLQSPGGSGYPGENSVPVPLMVTGNGLPPSQLSVSCAADFGGTCTGDSLVFTVSPSSGNVMVSIPAGTSTGQHTLTVTASYPGAAGAGNSLSRTIAVPFTVVDFSGTLSTSAVTMTPSSTAPVSVTVTGTAGFAGTVNLGCSGASLVTCSFNLNPTLNGGPVTAVLTLTSSFNAKNKQPASPFAGGRLLYIAAMLPFGLLLGRRSRKRLQLVLLIFGVAALSQVVGCGSNGVNVAPKGSGEAPSTYAITVNGTLADSNLTHTLGIVTVTVDH